MNNLLFIPGVGGTELLLILVVVLIFFGAKKIPEFARGLGSGIRQFKDAVSGIKDEIENVAEAKPASEKPKELTVAETTTVTEKEPQ